MRGMLIKFFSYLNTGPVAIHKRLCDSGLRQGKRVARKWLKNRLAACASVLRVESVYWWENAMEEDSEGVRYIKTAHPYTVPCVCAIPRWAGTPTNPTTSRGSERKLNKE